MKKKKKIYLQKIVKILSDCDLLILLPHLFSSWMQYLLTQIPYDASRKSYEICYVRLEERKWWGTIMVGDPEERQLPMENILEQFEITVDIYLSETSGHCSIVAKLGWFKKR